MADMKRMPKTVYGTAQPFRVVLLGGPASGKTTLLTALWMVADHEAFPDEANSEFAHHRDCLNGIGCDQEAIRATGMTPSLPSALPFHIRHEEREMVVETFDYAGEKSLSFFADTEDDFKARLADADAVLLLVDSYALCRVTSWQAWVNESQVDFLFRWLRDVLSDRHDGGLPFGVVCTRSDLTAPDLLGERSAQMRESLSDCGLSADVTHLTAFGRHQAEETLPDLDEDALPSGFLMPADRVEGCPAFVELLARMQERHRRTLRRDHVRGALGLGTVLVLTALALGWASGLLLERAANPDKPIKKLETVKDPTDPSELESKFPELGNVKDVLTLPKLNDHFTEEYAGNPEALAKWRKAYWRTLRESVTRKIPSLRFDTQEARWKDRATVEFVEHCEEQFRLAGFHEEVELLRSARLEVLRQASSPELELKEAQNLVREFRQWGARPPDKLVKIVRDLAEQKFRDELRGSLREPIPPARLYGTRIPELVRDAERYEVDDAFGRELRELRDYCRLLCETKKFSVRLTAYSRRGDLAETLDIRIEMTCGGELTYVPPDQNGKARSVGDFEGDMQFSDEHRPDVPGIAWEFDQSYEILIRDYDGPDRAFVSWSSNSLSESLKREGYDLRGLTFMVFRDCSRYWKAGRPGEWYRGDDYSDIESQLVLTLSPELRALINVPEVLLRANGGK
ncbi:MAG: hypothetical protein HN742_10780 [Lentisphaerae bacterium]|jgi:hypothetical protein|nr:hypothetical protein [Lentisphaerota bacterium]MBT4818314.1 hypothetical protein [Lentisphaerota bacterium]MBT5608912.1 hypothetical protein [Lentisphaerota bacterium]MBT7053504.1 hypothetical protein [Lentisphaerota bacterium]MBT7842348.1 hypothetical protein [Lentisphaerota bacterium]